MYDNAVETTLTTGAIILISVLSLAVCAAIIVGVWKMFEKGGEGGWKSLIPFYNTYILYKLSWGIGALFLLLLVPIADIFMIIVTPFKTAKAYGLTAIYGFGLLFLPFIFYPLIGFGKCQYIGPDGKPAGNVYVINQYNYNGVTPGAGMPGGPQADVYQAQPQPQEASAGGDAMEKLGDSMQSLKNGVSKLFHKKNAEDQEVRDQYSYQQPAVDPGMNYGGVRAGSGVMDEEFRFCTNCGAKIRKTARFCTNCGQEVAAPAPAPIPAATPASAAFAAPAAPEAPAAPAMDPFGFPEMDSQLENTLMTETELMDYGEKTEILLDDPVVITPSLTMISEDDEGEKEEIRISTTPFVIGRTTANADYAVDARGISRRHLQIDYEDGTYYVTDLNSTNGVFINDVKIPAGERSIVENDDIINIGQRRYIVNVQQLN